MLLVTLSATSLMPVIYEHDYIVTYGDSEERTSTNSRFLVADSNGTPVQAGEIKCVQWYSEDPYPYSNGSDSLRELAAAIPNCTYLQLKCEVNTIGDNVTAQTDASSLMDALSVARSLGYKIIFRVQMSDSTPARLLVPAHADSWFASYTDVVKQYAIFAQNQNVEGFCMGCEFTLLETSNYNNYWNNLITELRAVYSGKLWYETNYWPYSDEWATENNNSTKCLAQKLSLTWFSRLDCIAVSAYWEVGGRPDNYTQVPTVQSLVYGWNNYRYIQDGGSPSMWIESPVADLEKLSKTFNKTILIVSGLTSAMNASTQPWQSSSYYSSTGIFANASDLSEQRNWYEALFEVFYGQDWVAGFEFDAAWSTRANHPFAKKEPLLEGKPAENITDTWFARTLPGDLNQDFKVSLADLVLFALAYTSKPGDPKWNSKADLDGNGIVDQYDLAVLAQHYGQHYP